MDELQLLVLQAVRARAQYNDALQELAFKATGFGLLSHAVIGQIEEMACSDHTHLPELEAVANMAQGTCH